MARPYSVHKSESGFTHFEPKTLERINWLVHHGIVTSIAFGPSKWSGTEWSVTCLGPGGQEFDRPQQAADFDHAIEIAVLHSIKLGFVEGAAP
jgi:hypothetical protein